MLYRKVDPLEEGVSIQYVGVYVLAWRRVLNGKIKKPTVGFVAATEEEIRAELKEKK